MLSAKFALAAFSASVLLAQDQPRPNFRYNTADPQEKAAAKTPNQVNPPAKPQEPSQTPPPVMHFCGQNCITLQLDHGRYVSTTDMPAVPKGSSVWTVGSFTRDSVILHRVDSSQGRPIFQGTYSGKISPEGNSVVNVAADGQPSNGRLKITWEAALNSIPGSNEELAKVSGVNLNGPPTVASMLNQQTPWGMTPLQLMAAFFGGDAGGGGGDLTERIPQLEAAVGNARSHCIHYHNSDGSCTELSEAQGRLTDARVALRDEIHDLIELQKTLVPDCNGGNQEACKKLDQVNAQLKKDQTFTINNFLQ